jgi:hypothetical protein
VGKVEFGMHEKREGLVGDKVALSLSRNVRCEEEARNELIANRENNTRRRLCIALEKSGEVVVQA